MTSTTTPALHGWSVDLDSHTVTREVTRLPQLVALVELDEVEHGSEYAIEAISTTGGGVVAVNRLADPRWTRIALDGTDGLCHAWCGVCDDTICRHSLATPYDGVGRDAIVREVLEHLLRHHEGTALATTTLARIAQALDDDARAAGSWAAR